jgi:hypothetical protein
MASAGLQGTSNLEFEETTNENLDLMQRKSRFCRVGRTQQWNSEVDADTLEIYHDKKVPGGSGLTTPDYNPFSNE